MREYTKKTVRSNKGYRKTNLRYKERVRYDYSGLLRRLKREYSAQAMHDLLHPAI